MSRLAESAEAQVAVERVQAGELDAFEADEVILQYSREAKELWKFCNLGTPRLRRESYGKEPPGDWYGFPASG